MSGIQFRSILRSALVAIFPFFANSEAFALDYDKAIQLDAEELAETGIKAAYDVIIPSLTQYVKDPTTIEEIIDPEAPSYAIRVSGREYVIYSPGLPDEGHSWGTATYVLFKAINDQLQHADVRFYALNGGNDLFGIFLSHEEAEKAKRSPDLRPTDWPYLPTSEYPWYGQFH
jgi:hypothetical protein